MDMVWRMRMVEGYRAWAGTGADWCPCLRGFVIRTWRRTVEYVIKRWRKPP